MTLKKCCNRVAVSFALMVTLCACGSTAPSRFYTLSPMTGSGAPGKSPAATGALTVGVGPVGIPDYLERPQIVTRSGDNGLEMAEYDRWAGSLKQDIMRALIHDISAYLPPGTSVLSWKRGIPIDCRVAVEVTSLDVVPGRAVQLRGQWALYGRDAKSPTLHTRAFSEPLAGTDMSTAVAGIGRAVGQLSRAIAADIEAETTAGGSRTP